jgi:hypothetical protein
MIDLVHLVRLREQRQRYEAAQAAPPSRPEPATARQRRHNDRRNFLRIGAAALFSRVGGGTAEPRR